MLEVRSLTAPGLILCCLLSAPALAADRVSQRTLFLEAESALERGDQDTYAGLKRQLSGYALLPYLEYRRLTRQLSSQRDQDIQAFLARYDGSVSADRLRKRWLRHLGRQGAWQRFLAFYQPTTDTGLRCQRLNALLKTGEREAALDQVDAIWLQGKSQPKACDPVFAAWEDAGLRTDAKTWQRIELAMSAGEWRLARYLGQRLPSAEREWVSQWVALYKNPRQIEQYQGDRKSHPYRGRMLGQAVRRLAIRDGLEALQEWQRIKKLYDFDAQEITRTEHYIIRNLVREPAQVAYDFIRQVDMGEAGELAHAARMRSALLREDWPQLKAWFDDLPESMRREAKWRYWLARATEGTGDFDRAKALYAEVAQERSYYGFMAADQINADYHLDHIETPVDPLVMAQIANIDAVERARELFYLERWTDARREWIDATRDMNPAQLKAAAKIAEQKGWHDRAIFTLARTGYWDDLELRFPLVHSTLVDENAARNGIDKAWIFAVMRQESAFMHNARSHAGAMGLMQLMPATARAVSRDLKRKPPRRNQLLDPEINILLGSAYLRQMKSELADSSILATAAYNAGPHRVTRWLPERTLPADIWIELVPFRETRRYLQRVLAYTAIYEKRMGHEPVRLRYRLHPVAPAIERMTRSDASAMEAG
jgi:soluble lytic murein transglycosylase